LNFSTQSYQCASCAAPLEMKTGLSVYAVCSYCGAAQIKSGASLETLGQVPQLNGDLSPVQIGTRGTPSVGLKQGQRFEVIGRIRLKWERATWDEWYILFEDQTSGWLAEAQGFYYLSFEEELPEPLKAGDFDPANIGVGGYITLRSESYSLKDKKDAHCVYSEGELPFTGAVSEHVESFDFTGQNMRFVTISRTRTEANPWGTYQLFRGLICTFPELNFEFLRNIPGWET